MASLALNRYTARIEKLRKKLDAATEQKYTIITNPDLSQNAIQRKASEFWHQTAQEFASEADSLVSDLKRDRDAAQARATAAKSKAAQSFDFARLTFEAAEWKTRFSQARDLDTLEQAYRMAVSAGDAHTQRAASVAVSEVADSFSNGALSQKTAVNRLKREAQAAIDKATTPETALGAESDVEQLTQAALLAKAAINRVSNAFGNDGHMVRLAAERIRVTHSSSGQETFVDVVEASEVGPAHSNGFFSVTSRVELKE